MVGISIAKDLTYVPLGFDEHYMKNLNFISPIVKLEEHLFSKVD
jgi:hypothetical protein